MSSDGKGLPPRYSKPWREPFDAPIRERLQPGCAVLDIGSGRHPSVPATKRPTGVRYVGLDMAAQELEAAGEDAYSETVIADATLPRPELAGQFDLAISWQVLEHVRDLEATVANIRSYLVPGGLSVSMFSGSWSVFGIINRLLPDRIGAKIVDRTMKRTENNIPVFPAYYDKCTARQFGPLFSGWGHHEITPLYNGAGYFDFFPPLRRAYLGYENAVHDRQWADLATHYLIVAER